MNRLFQILVLVALVVVGVVQYRILQTVSLLTVVVIQQEDDLMRHEQKIIDLQKKLHQEPTITALPLPNYKGPDVMAPDHDTQIPPVISEN